MKSFPSQLFLRLVQHRVGRKSSAMYVFSSFLATAIPFVLRYNRCVLIQATFFFKVGRLTLLLPLGRGSRRNSAARADIQANDVPIHQVNSCGQEVVHYTIAFTLSVITKRATGGLVGGVGFVKAAGSRGDSGRAGRGSCLRVFCTACLMCLWWATAPLGFMKMIADPFCKSTVRNGHLSVWNVSRESRCAALQEAHSGNSYLTCTADRLQLTERCHLRRESSAPDYETQKCQSRTGGLLTHVSGGLLWDNYLHALHLYTDNTAQMIKVLAYLEDCYSENCSVILTSHPCWKCR